MARVEGIDRVIVALRKHGERVGKEKVSVVVGFSTNYALYVHENLEAYHRVGQAKYLEQPAREHRGTIAEVIVGALKKGASFVHAILMGALRLQREAQLLTPVDTGALRNSAFTRIEEGG